MDGKTNPLGTKAHPAPAKYGNKNTRPSREHGETQNEVANGPDAERPLQQQNSKANHLQRAEVSQAHPRRLVLLGATWVGE